MRDFEIVQRVLQIAQINKSRATITALQTHFALFCAKY